MHSTRFEAAIPAIKQLQAYAVDHMAAGIGWKCCVHCEWLPSVCRAGEYIGEALVMWDVAPCQVVSDDDDDDDDTRILRNFGSQLRLSRRHIPEHLDSLATLLQEPEILQNLPPSYLKLFARRYVVTRRLIRQSTGFCLEGTESLVPGYDKCPSCGRNCVKK